MTRYSTSRELPVNQSRDVEKIHIQRNIDTSNLTYTMNLVEIHKQIFDKEINVSALSLNPNLSISLLLEYKLGEVHNTKHFI